MKVETDLKFKWLVFSAGCLIGAIASFFHSCATAPATGKIIVQPDTISMLPAAWVISYSPNMPTHPSGSGWGNGSDGWYFDFPTRDGVHYVMVPYEAKKPHSLLVISYRVTAVSGTPKFVSSDPALGLAPNFRPMLERQRDNMVSEFYRWWSSPNHATLIADGQVHTLSVPLIYDRWTDVYGKSNASEFAASMKSLMAVGITFGGGSSYGHGCYVTGGQVKFELINYAIN